MSKNIIIINRGDSCNIRFNLNITKIDPDTIYYFGLMDPNQWFEEALVKKRFTNKDIIVESSDESGIKVINYYLQIELKPSDTVDLYPGVYYYAIKSHRVNIDKKVDEVKTLLNKTKFIIND